MAWPRRRRNPPRRRACDSPLLAEVSCGRLRLVDVVDVDRDVLVVVGGARPRSASAAVASAAVASAACPRRARRARPRPRRGVGADAGGQPPQVADNLVVVRGQPERVQVGAEGAHQVLDLVLDQVGRVAGDLQLLGQRLRQREQVALHPDRLLPASGDAGEAQDLLLRRRVLGRKREAAQHLVERARRIRHLALAHLGAQAQQLDALARLGARARHARVDVQQPAPVLGLLRQPLQVGQQLAPGRIGGQRVAQHREGPRRIASASPRRSARSSATPPAARSARWRARARPRRSGSAPRTGRGARPPDRPAAGPRRRASPGTRAGTTRRRAPHRPDGSRTARRSAASAPGARPDRSRVPAASRRA